MFIPGRFSRWVIFQVFFILCSGWLFSQGYLVHHYSELEGLPGPWVYDVAQGRSGEMWFTTGSGIARYDGISWKTFTLRDGLPVLSFLKLAVDRQGKVWALSNSPRGGFAVVYYDGLAWRALPRVKEPALLTVNVTEFRLIPQTGNPMPILAVGTQNHGLFLWDGEKWHSFTKKFLLFCFTKIKK
ncbi:MAG: hypothetical protein GY940_43380 [bacterium]|nr:hypothetical protein [bacterium]